MKILLAIAVFLLAFGGVQHVSARKDGDCKFPPAIFPKTYLNYHLGPDEKIEIDGVLDEPAWIAVNFTDKFVDIQGENMPAPRFDTYVKLRWDDEFLYVGAYVEEPQAWANLTQHESVVFHDNDFEVFVDPDGNTHNYKELEINALNTTFELMMDKPYLDGGNYNESWQMPTMLSAVFVDGEINNPAVGTKYWTVEMALPLKDYVVKCVKATAPPKNGDQWRINFSRVEYRILVVGNHYEKVPNVNEDNWVWSPQYAIAMHIPERWGYMQFSTLPVGTDTFVQDPTWGIRTALAQTYYAQKTFASLTGYFASDLNQLSLPSYVLDGSLGTRLPQMQGGYGLDGFNVTVAPSSPGLPTGHINSERLFWFT